MIASSEKVTAERFKCLNSSSHLGTRNFFYQQFSVHLSQKPKGERVTPQLYSTRLANSFYPFSTDSDAEEISILKASLLTRETDKTEMAPL